MLTSQDSEGVTVLKNVKKFEWLESFAIGVDKIDSDHQNLFKIAQELYEIISNKSPQTCTELLNQFILRAEEHFAAEEALLERTGYPDLDSHKIYHRQLIVGAQQVKAQCLENIKDGQPEHCYVEAVSFLIDDIVRGDAPLKSFLEYHGHAGH